MTPTRRNLKSTHQRMLARYTTGDFAGSAIAIRRAVGHGIVYYYGAAFSQAVCDQLIGQIGMVSPSQSRLRVPASVELGIRRTLDRRAEFWFLPNYSSAEQTVEVLERVQDLVHNVPVPGTPRLQPFDVAVLSQWANSGR